MTNELHNKKWLTFVRRGFFQSFKLYTNQSLGTGVDVRVIFVLVETGVPDGNAYVRLGDHMAISHDDAG